MTPIPQRGLGGERFKLNSCLRNLTQNENTIPQHYVSSYGYWPRLIIYDCVVLENILHAKFGFLLLYIDYIAIRLDLCKLDPEISRKIWNL